VEDRLSPRSARHGSPLLIVLALVALVAAACGGSSSPAPSTEPGTSSAPESSAPSTAPSESAAPSTPAESAGPADFSNAATALNNLDSYQFNVSIASSSSSSTSGVSAGTTNFVGTVINKPSTAQSLDLIEKDPNGTVTQQTSYILIGSQAWTRDGGDTGTWVEIPSAQAAAFIQALSVFRPEQMFTLYFGPASADNTFVGDEQKNGVAAKHYKGGETIGAILGSIAGVQGTWDSEIWIATDGGYVVSSTATVAAASASDGGSFSVVVDITNINDSSNAVNPPG
jgi:hypothetical protein